MNCEREAAELVHMLEKLGFEKKEIDQIVQMYLRHAAERLAEEHGA